MTAVLRVDIDGTLSLHPVADDDLSHLQKLVGGYIEYIFGPGWCGYVNETGLLDGLPLNTVATMLARDGGYDALVGPVVFFGPADPNGTSTDVPLFLLATAVTIAGGVLPEGT
jgi:hypothetical protein